MVFSGKFIWIGRNWLAELYHYFSFLLSATFSLLMTLLLLYKSSTNVSIFLQCRSISEKEISFLILSGKYIAIALVDQNKLR